jgi:hypothetical protein
MRPSVYDAILPPRLLTMPNSMDIQANQHYKTRCVAKGCSQIEGVDFNELFAAVAIGLVPGHAQGRQGHEVYYFSRLDGVEGSRSQES